MSRIVLISSFCFWCAVTLTAQEKVNWLTWEQALELNKVEKKKIIVDVFTTWCTWCQKMDKRTFQKENIASFINANFYAVKFDAEQKEDIIYNNKLYSYVSSFGKRGYHELAEEILKGRMSYPTTVFIDEQLEVIQPIPGFQDSRTLEMIMNYFSGNYYTSTPWHKFEKNYNSNNFSPPSIINGRIPRPAVMQTVKNP